MAQIPKRRVSGPAWHPGDPTLTVGEIAARLAPIAPDTKATIEKIRHWTRELMLLPVGQVHAGTGKHRLYDANAVYDAAILMLTTRAGLNIASMRYLVDALTVARFALVRWKKEGGPLYLHISRGAPTDRTEVEIVRKEPEKPIADLTIIIDLAMLFSRIGGAPETASKRKSERDGRAG